MIKIERKSLTWEVVLPLMVASVTNMRYGIVNSEVLLMRFMQKKQSCNCYSCKKNHAIVPSSKCVVMWMVLYVNWGGSEASPFLVTFNLHIIQVTKRWQRPLMLPKMFKTFWCWPPRVIIFSPVLWFLWHISSERSFWLPLFIICTPHQQLTFRDN